jgi:hypothetical protein
MQPLLTEDAGKPIPWPLISAHIAPDDFLSDHVKDPVYDQQHDDHVDN